VRVLIVEGNPLLRRAWAVPMRAAGWTVVEAVGEHDAIDMIQNDFFDAMILDLVLPGGSSLAISDFAAFRQPVMQVILVTDTAMFSDGSIFSHCANVRAVLPLHVAPGDLVAVTEHHARAA
jgi:DNA-binding NtrC family response regulator